MIKIKIFLLQIYFLPLLFILPGCKLFEENLDYGSQNGQPLNKNYTYTHSLSTDAIAKAAKLTDKQLSQLLAMEAEDRGGWNFKAILPTYIPDGFEITKFEVLEWEKGYDITIGYYNRQRVCFEVVMQISGGGGPPATSKTIETFSPALGKVIINLTDFTQESEPPLITVDMYSGLIKSGYLYSVSSFNGNKYNDCKLINTKEFLKIIESLHYLNP